MEKEEKIVVVLLAMALTSLAVAYITFMPDDSVSDAGQLTAMSAIGDEVIFEGTVVDKRSTLKGGHLILSIEYDSQVINVFIPDNAGATYVDKTVNEMDRVRIVGILDEYNGESEVVVHSKDDVKVL